MPAHVTEQPALRYAPFLDGRDLEIESAAVRVSTWLSLVFSTNFGLSKLSCRAISVFHSPQAVPTNHYRILPEATGRV